ncbi:MAG: LysE family translocator [Sciscionella sp.]
MPQHLMPFLLVVTVLIVTPGPDMVLVLRNGVRGGASAGWWTGLGCVTGNAAHATAAVVGLSALLAASATAYTVVRLCGAVYLMYLGVTALWKTRRSMRSALGTAEVSKEPDVTITRWAAFRQGMVTDLLNPKIALLFITLLPQFVAADESRPFTSAVLAVLFLAYSVAWWRVFSLLGAAISNLLARERVSKAFERLTGAVLIILGLRVATE